MPVPEDCSCGNGSIGVCLYGFLDIGPCVHYSDREAIDGQIQTREWLSAQKSKWPVRTARNAFIVVIVVITSVNVGIFFVINESLGVLNKIAIFLLNSFQ